VSIVKLDSQYFLPVKHLQANHYTFYECVTQKTILIDEINFIIPANLNFRFAKNEDKKKLIELASKNTFKKSHFYLDLNFDLENIDKMYSKWIDSALDSEKRVIVIEEENEIAGVFIYSIANFIQNFDKKIGIWEFAAIDSKFRNKGLGMRLFYSALQACINDGVHVIDTILVEKNIISQRFHDKLGFRLVNTYYTFHRWFKEA